MNNQKIIVGLGSGRCGTASLAALLDMQVGITATHEGFVPLPWYYSDTHYQYYKLYLANLRPLGIGADVSFWHLRYINFYLRDFSNIKFVCLKRDFEETVQGLYDLTEKLHVNHFTDKGSKFWNSKQWMVNDEDTAKFRNCFPKYNLDKKDAIRKYCKLYYDTCAEIEKTIPNQFKIYDMKYVLNTKEGQVDLFNFLEIKPSIIVANISFTKRGT